MKGRQRRVRYAVVGVGHIAQAAVLPAFRHARENSELAVLFSGDRRKRAELSERYKVPAFDYKAYEARLESEKVDAVYIALPNHLHCEYAVRAARKGVHVLVEKPMAVTEAECGKMIREAERHSVKLMVAYRLHFEPGNMAAVELAKSGKLGALRYFESVFALQVREGNIRLRKSMGGGAVYDLGVYCINAARYFFREEPEEVFAYSAALDDKRFKEVDEMTAVILRFPHARLASFTCSFASSDISYYRVAGTRGEVCMDPAYEYVGDLKKSVKIEGETRSRVYKAKDQFAPELLYFSDCILHDERPEPDGWEGLADVRVVEAVYRSVKTGRPVGLAPMPSRRNPSAKQVKIRPPVRKPGLVHAQSASV